LWDESDDIDLNNIKVKDERSIAEKYRFIAWVDPEHRFVINGHWKLAIRRAANMVDLPISKYSIKLSSDILDFKAWTAGQDTVEFGLTKALHIPAAEMGMMLNQNLRGMRLVNGILLEAGADALRKTIGVRYYQMEVQEREDVVRRVVREFHRGDPRTLVLLHDVHRRGIRHDEFDLHVMVKDIWFTKEGTRLLLHVLITGKATPYDVYRCLFGRKGPTVYRFPGILRDSFVNMDGVQEGFYTKACEKCGMVYPVNPLGDPAFKDAVLPFCVQCAAIEKGEFVV